MKNLIPSLIILAVLISCNKQVLPPEAVNPVPTEQQLAWQEMEYYAFIHFGPNTFTDMEWGFGDEDPAIFNPAHLDCRQWAGTISKAGMKGVIIGTKHHDGFCLWPYEGTEHSVKNSPWKNGQGNVLKDLREACDEYGLKLGFYLSPWDRNHADYAGPEYIEYYRAQIKDILTNYGEIFEIWFDGANGGDGYYGGANETRRIDRKTYYSWDSIYQLVYSLQPNIIIFSDKGPGTRWIGNEKGFAGETNWSLLNPDSIVVGGVGGRLQKMLNEGDEYGTHWIPGETDVSIRPGWFYHESQDDKVKTLEHLLDIYYKSVGRNSNLLLNLPVDKRGLVHENDSMALMKLREYLDLSFANNLAKEAKAEASSTRGNSREFSASNTIDGDKNTYWATDDDLISSNLVLDFGKPIKFNRFLVQEYIPLGQRIKAFNIEAWIDGSWQLIDEATTIGYKRILRFPMVESRKIRLNILDAKACPVISNIEVYKAPELISNPAIVRNKEGEVSIRCSTIDPKILFTIDGSEPGPGSPLYTHPFEMKNGGTVRAVAVLDNDEKSEIVSASFDICSEKWNIQYVDSYHEAFPASNAIDGDPATMWHTDWGPDKTGLPHELQIDLGEEILLKGFTYTPRTDNNLIGVITKFNFYTSLDGKQWEKVISKGEFSNIQNNPVKQEVRFEKPLTAKFIRLEALGAVDKREYTSANEIGIITK